MSFAFLPLYTGDYLRDTRHLSPAKHGIYMLLLMHCWDQKGPVPLDEQEAAGIANCRSTDEVESLRYVLNRFFVKMADGWYNNRMAEEVAKAEQISHQNRAAGLKSAEKRRELRALRRATGVQRALSERSTRVGTPTPIKEKEKDKGGASDDALSLQASQVEAQPPPAAPPAPVGVTEKETWDFAVALLTKAGTKEATARTLIGSWLKEWNHATVLDACRDALEAADPKSYVRAILNDKPKRGENRAQRIAEEAWEMMQKRDRERGKANA
jgi:uncharacterized protein YdaU (DUF1376 family)